MIRIAMLAVATAIAFSVPASADQTPIIGGSAVNSATNLLENRMERPFCHICPGRPRMVCRCS
jgi:hypothetical protein